MLYTRTLTVQDAPPINITTLTIVSGASNTAYAKAGDTLSLKLVVSDTISTHDVQILNTTMTSESRNDKTLDLQAQVSSNVTESNVVFTITVTNVNETTLTVTEDDLTGPTVFIDTVSPHIELISGPANYSIVNGTDPIIRNVTVTDGDPNYSGNFTLDANATVIDNKRFHCLQLDVDGGCECSSATVYILFNNISTKQGSSKVAKISTICFKADSYDFTCVCKIVT